MDKNNIKYNLEKTIEELAMHHNINEDLLIKSLIKINPIYEPNKNNNSRDDLVRLTLLSKKNTMGRLFTIDTFITLISGFAPLFPNWVNVSLLKQAEEEYILNLDVSLRFRKPSELHNKETEHPPFKAI